MCHLVNGHSTLEGHALPWPPQPVFPKWNVQIIFNMPKTVTSSTSAKSTCSLASLN